MKVKLPNWITRKRYRVIEIVKGDNSAKFYPQKQYKLLKFTCFWVKMRDDGYATAPIREFNTLDKANQYLYTLEKDERAELIINKKTHMFDAVFYKLKQTETKNE